MCAKRVELFFSLFVRVKDLTLIKLSLHHGYVSVQ